ncbi:SH3 domain-containing protein [Streptomyces sp. NPDC005648]|uniref:SH3 domain-containing protein n=1 Tax=Streptomyces sp. NPDC005648 TaxID=3157044 RepID=UPI0033B2BCE2
MIRRTLRGGLLAAFAVVAVFPVAAVADAGPAASAHAWNSTPPHLSVPWQPSGTPSTPTRHTHVPTKHTHVKRHARRHHTVTRVRHQPHFRHLRGLRHVVATRAWGDVSTGGPRLNVRSGPGTRYRVVGSRPAGARVAVICEVRGSGVRGDHRWYRLPHRKGYVSAHYVRSRGAVRWC